MNISFADELEYLMKQGLFRKMRLIEGGQQEKVVLDGKEVLLFCSNNYLGLASHPLLKNAAVKAVEQYGTSSGASRLISGNMVLHEKLEKRIATFKGMEAALLFNSGYAANTGLIQALAGRGDLIFSDRLNHASIIDGAFLSRARLVRYPHNNIKALERLLEANRTTGRRLIITDGVFSMDGDLAKLPELVSLKKKYGALLVVDDAHGSGVLGRAGRGSCEFLDCQENVDIQMGTFGKAFGSFGSYVAASREIIDYLVNKARSFIFSTSLPPSVLAASLAAVDLVDSEEGAELRNRLASNAEYFRSRLLDAGFDIMGSETQIIPVLVGPADKTMKFAGRLLDKGIFVQGIRPPTIPAGRCRLRCTVMATHGLEDLQRTVKAIVETGKEFEIVR